MGDDTKRFEEKLDKVVDCMVEIKTTLAGQASDLKYHIKRTDLLDESIKTIREDLKPVQAHVLMVHGALKLIGMIALVATIIEGFSYLRH
jgi:hypothetical protein